MKKKSIPAGFSWLTNCSNFVGFDSGVVADAPADPALLPAPEAAVLAAEAAADVAVLASLRALGACLDAAEPMVV